MCIRDRVEIDQKRKHALETLSKENLQESIANMKAILGDVVSEYNDLSLIHI